MKTNEINTLQEQPAKKGIGGIFNQFKSLTSWITLSPTLLLVAIFVLIPIPYALYLSFHRYILTRPDDHSFIGLRNYTTALGDVRVPVAVQNTIIFTIISVIVVLVLGLAVALLLNQKLPGFGVIGGLILLPWAVPVVSAGTLWKLLLNGNFGAINGLLYQLGFIEQYFPFLGTMPSAFISILIASVWRLFPFATILFLAGLQTIPRDCYSAAKVDGASNIDLFRFITLPLLRPTILILLIFLTMIGITTFDVVYVMTGGGPGTGTTLIAWITYLFTFTSLNLGQGAAMSVLIAIVLIVLVLIYMRLLTERMDE